VEGHNAVDLVALLLPPLRHEGPPFLFLSYLQRFLPFLLLQTKRV
jgi:hypothetical protein